MQVLQCADCQFRFMAPEPSKTRIPPAGCPRCSSDQIAPMGDLDAVQPRLVWRALKPVWTVAAILMLAVVGLGVLGQLAGALRLWHYDDQPELLYAVGLLAAAAIGLAGGIVLLWRRAMAE
jgi:hypothetical protein